MKKILLAIFVLFPAFAAPLGAAGYARAATPEIGIENIRLEITPAGQAVVSFTVETRKESFGNAYGVHYVPAIVKDGYRMELTGVLIRGRRFRIMDERDGLSARCGIDLSITEALEPGMTLDYRVAIPYEEWMRGAQLVFTTTVMNCNAATDPMRDVVAANLFVGDTARIVNTIEIMPPAPPLSVADRQAERFPFVAHISAFNRAMEEIEEGVTFDENMLLHLGKAVGRDQRYVEKFVERNKPGSLMIYYRQNRHDIDPDYMDNYVWLRQLVESVEAIERSGDSRVQRVVIAGFASPEGTPEHNDVLAWERAVAVRDLILRTTPLEEDKIRVYNGSEDWLGLRTLVEGSILSRKEKEDVLEIIDTMPREQGAAKNGRLGALQRLNGGRTYKYLYDNFFPELRNAAYIKVYYENTH